MVFAQMASVALLRHPGDHSFRRPSPDDDIEADKLHGGAVGLQLHRWPFRRGVFVMHILRPVCVVYPFRRQVGIEALDLPPLDFSANSAPIPVQLRRDPGYSSTGL